MSAAVAFDDAWRTAVKFRRVSRDLRSLVGGVYQEIVRDPVDGPALKETLERLLEFLVSERGRTDANLCTADAFFAVIGVPQSVPPQLRGICDDLSGALHDTVYAPNIATTFDSTPEQLLARLRELEI